jgi:uncharacterized hydrophobic protein (TIGR00271 family)
MSGISLDQQIPPVPLTSDRNADLEPPKPRKQPQFMHNPRVRRAKAWMRFFRMKFARFVLLPELSRHESQELRQAVREDGALTNGYMLMCALSAGIATLGLLQSSTAVVIGAMLISPLMSPIAALGFGFASLDGSRIREAVRVVAVGAAIGILTGVLLTWLSPIRNATPEILARTQPTLLDLAVALFSGIAGGYATVIRKGGTAIGVAIATALMPPLAVLGYGIGVLQVQFALGALLLFLTNLAAITFSFALVARLSGAARPFYRVEWTPKYTAFLIAAFVVLAIPLTMTLVRIKNEASIRAAATSAILDATGGKKSEIAQLEVSWPLFGKPSVEALVVTPTYSPKAVEVAAVALARRVGAEVDIELRQVLAADLQSQTRAMVDAAMERTAAGIAADVPPFAKIRAAVGLPTRSIWTNTAERTVYVEPVPAPEWTLADYAETEKAVSGIDDRWTVRIVPPAQAQIDVALPQAETEEGEDADKEVAGVTPALAVWALRNWGMSRVRLDAPEGDRANPLRKMLTDAGIGIANAPAEERRGLTDEQARILVYSISPTRAAAEAEAARLKAEAEEATRKAEAAEKALEKAKAD